MEIDIICPVWKMVYITLKNYIICIYMSIIVPQSSLNSDKTTPRKSKPPATNTLFFNYSVQQSLSATFSVSGTGAPYNHLMQIINNICLSSIHLTTPQYTIYPPTNTQNVYHHTRPHNIKYTNYPTESTQDKSIPLQQ